LPVKALKGTEKKIPIVDRFPDGIGMVLHTEGKLDGVLLRGGEGGPQGPVPQLQHRHTDAQRKPITKLEYADFIWTSQSVVIYRGIGDCRSSRTLKRNCPENWGIKIPRKETPWSQSQFLVYIHISVSNLYIPIIGLPYI
jgi:hypothetical protein